MAARTWLRDPRTGTTDTAVELTTPDELDEVVAGVRASQPRWAAASPEDRAATLVAWADAIEAAGSDLVDALVRDTGRLAESRLEVQAVSGSLRRWSRLAPDLLAPEPDRPSEVPGFVLRQGYDPYPVVAVISPWNFPLLLALLDAVPALAAGAGVVVKPSELTPRFVPVLRRTAAEVPALGDALGFVVGGPDLGRALVERADAVCFTGSVPTGRAVAVAAAERLIPAYLELGGKDPAIVTATADVRQAARALLWGGTANAGQSCLSIERVYAVADVHDRLVDELVAGAQGLRLAVPEPGDGPIGPIIAERQIAVIERHLADAVDRGADVRCGGRIEQHGGGTYLPPTVVTDVDHTMALMTEETFGPILPVMRVADVDDAITWANATEYGLSAAVFAGDLTEAAGIADRLRAGAVSCNDAALTAIVHDGEKQAYGRSGLGPTRMGPAALHRFHRRRVAILKTDPSPDPWWYPPLA